MNDSSFTCPACREEFHQEPTRSEGARCPKCGKWFYVGYTPPFAPAIPNRRDQLEAELEG